MILHGYVNYAGAPLNYSGSPDYDILRSIENGASIYYIIGYQNTDIMKDDEEFNKYYSISYEHWFDDIVEKYAIINSQIGNLQDYHIVGHEILIGERVIDRSEQIDNLKALMDEFVQNFRATLESEIDIALGNLYNPENPTLNKDKRIGVEADLNNLVAVALAQRMSSTVIRTSRSTLTASRCPWQLLLQSSIRSTTSQALLLKIS